MLISGGYEIARYAGIPWEDRMNVDGWPSRAGMYCNDEANSLCMRLIDYPVGSTEPRHVHAGMHATTVLRGTTQVDGLTLGPLDVILGPSNEPHGPLHYPQGCQLFSAFVGSYFHSEVETLAAEKQYRLIRSAQLPWVESVSGIEVKTLVDRGCGRVLLEALRAAPGAKIGAPAFRAAIVVEGVLDIDDERLGARDFFYVDPDVAHAPLVFAAATTLLTVTLR